MSRLSGRTTRQTGSKSSSRLALRRIVATILIITGVALLVLCARAIDLGIAPPQGPSQAQVWLGAGGVLLTVTGIALVVQPFAPTPTDHPADD